MYFFLNGIITEKIIEPAGLEKLILDVNNIGYEIFTTISTLNTLGNEGTAVKVYTTLIHKEDQMTIFGFKTLVERELFNLLNSVSGIGPKTALSLLNNLTTDEITSSILNNDPDTLSCAQGIGERTANRMILELKGKIENWKYLPETRDQKSEIRNQNFQHSATNEARSVLQALGYSSSEINQAFTQAKSNGDHKDPESLIHSSLKWLATVKK